MTHMKKLEEQMVYMLSLKGEQDIHIEIWIDKKSETEETVKKNRTGKRIQGNISIEKISFYEKDLEIGNCFVLGHF